MDMWIVSTVYFQQIAPQTRELSMTVVNFTWNYFQKYDKLSGNKCSVTFNNLNPPFNLLSVC